MSYEKKYRFYKEIAENYFQNNFSFPCVEELARPISYSFFPGGKRLRPILMLATADFLGVNFERILPFALATEMIHVSSLIHDDLPEIDNDDFRRGIPSCHKAFGSGYALLAGDGLLNLAYSQCLKHCNDEKDVKALSYLADCAGVDGMLGGQALDLKEYASFSEDDLTAVYVRKTSALFQGCFYIPAILMQSSNDTKALLKALGENFGLLFQFLDDICDCSDLNVGKINAVALYKIDGAKKMALHYKEEILKILSNLGKWDFMIELVNKLTEF